MADIRYTTVIIDSFNRADEPYPPGLLPPWEWTPVWDLPCFLENNGIGSPSFNPNDQAMSSWRGMPMGGDCEAWGIASGDAPLHDAYYYGLFRADGSGYYVRDAHNVLDQPWQLIRRDPGGGGSLLDQSAGDFLLTGYAPDYAIIQTVGSLVQAGYSQDAGANWTIMVSANDTTYRDDLYMSFGGQGGGPGWDAVGGGPFIRRRSQIFRHVYNDGRAVLV